MAIRPASGQVGTRVTITGTDLLAFSTSVIDVQLAGVTATLTSANDTHVFAVAAEKASAGGGDVVVTTDTGDRSVLPGAWTYRTAGNITDVSPASGQAGTVVTITGTNLLGGGAGVVDVVLANVSASAIVSHNDTHVVVVASHAVPRVDTVIIIANTGATIVSPAGVTWEYAAEGNITSVAPASGQHNTRVTITGVRLLGYGTTIARAFLAGISATVLTATNGEVVVAAGRASAAGNGSVVLVADTGATVVLDGAAFTYIPEGKHVGDDHF